MGTALGDEIRARRHALRLHQIDVAEMAGVSERFVRDAEHGKTTLRLDKLHALLDVLGLELHTRLRSPR